MAARRWTVVTRPIASMNKKSALNEGVDEPDEGSSPTDAMITVSVKGHTSARSPISLKINVIRDDPALLGWQFRFPSGVLRARVRITPQFCAVSLSFSELS